MCRKSGKLQLVGRSGLERESVGELTTNHMARCLALSLSCATKQVARAALVFSNSRIIVFRLEIKNAVMGKHPIC